MVSYLRRFKDIVSEINTHPWLEIVEFKVNPPASDDVLTAVAEKLGGSLADPIRSFYKEANGLKLYWKIKSNLTDEELDGIEEECDDYDIGVPDEEEEDDPFAQINLIPIEDSLIHRDWEGIFIFPDMSFEGEKVNFAGVNYDENDFEKRLRPFDLYSSYSCMAFLVEDRQSNPKLLRLSDYYIEWDNSRITDFASYMEMLFVTRGIVESRDRIYSEYRGDLKPPLTTGPDYWTKEHIPKLFRKR